MSAPTAEQDTAKQLRAELENACASERQLVVQLRNGDLVRARVTAILNGEIWFEKGPRIPLADVESVRGLR